MAARNIKMGGDGQYSNYLMKILLVHIFNGVAHQIECLNGIGDKCVKFQWPLPQTGSHLPRCWMQCVINRMPSVHYSSFQDRKFWWTTSSSVQASFIIE